MSDPTIPAAQAPDAGAPAPPQAVTPPAPAAAPQPPAQAVPAPRVLNPYASRTPAQAPSAPPVVAAPSAPAPDPRVDALLGVLADTVAQDMAALPANVSAAVKAIAGDDPVAQRKAINAMRANGIATPSSVIPAPANTAAPQTTAPTASSTSASDAALAARYDQLQKVAPTQAMLFRVQHREALARHAKSSAS